MHPLTADRAVEAARAAPGVVAATAAPGEPVGEAATVAAAATAARVARPASRDSLASRDRLASRDSLASRGSPARLVPVSVRAGIVVTGTEVLTGRVQDANGPWIADRLLELGVELAHITICGDRPTDIEAQLRFMAEQGVDLIVT